MRPRSRDAARRAARDFATRPMQRPTAVRGGGAFGAPHAAPFGGAHAPTRLGRAFRSVDFYRKLPRDMTEGTVSGSVMSIFAATLMAFLLLSELRSYASTSFDTKVVVDQERGWGIAANQL